MKKLLILIGIALYSIQFTNAQEISAPLDDLVQNEIIPEAPNNNSIWVKGHWQYNAGKYSWIQGAYIEKLANHNWVDGHWVKNLAQDTWKFEAGSWEIDTEVIKRDGITFKSGAVTNGSNVELIKAVNYSLN